MKRILVLAIVLASGMAHAGDFQLDGKSIKPAGQNDVGEALVEVSGKCGAAQVLFSNVRQVDGALIADDQAKLTIKGAKGALATGERDTFFLDSINDLACVASPKGPKLVLAAWCTARECPEVNYQVIDAESVRQLTFYDYEKPCTRACAEKALGAKLPITLTRLPQ